MSLTIYTKWQLLREFCIWLIVFQLIRSALTCKILSGRNKSEVIPQIRSYGVKYFTNRHIHANFQVSSFKNEMARDHSILCSDFMNILLKINFDFKPFCENVATIPIQSSAKSKVSFLKLPLIKDYALQGVPTPHDRKLLQCTIPGKFLDSPTLLLEANFK